MKHHHSDRGWLPALGLDEVDQDVYQPIGEIDALTYSEQGYVSVAVSEQALQAWSNRVRF